MRVECLLVGVETEYSSEVPFIMSSFLRQCNDVIAKSVSTLQVSSVELFSVGRELLFPVTIVKST